VCINEGEVDRYIEGLSVLASPPLTMPPSMKTSVAKSELMKSGTPKVKTPSSIEGLLIQNDSDIEDYQQPSARKSEYADDRVLQIKTRP